MSKDDDDSLDDVNSLMKRIGGKKKAAAPEKPEETPAAPPSALPPEQPVPAGSPSGGGDFSALMKKLGMANRPDMKPAARPVQATPPPLPPEPAVPEPERAEFSSLDDLLEDEIPPSPHHRNLKNLNTSQKHSRISSPAGMSGHLLASSLQT